MFRKLKVSNETTRYDHARVARLRTITEAAERLQLPLVRWRKLLTILNALEVQIQDGGDNPEVNRLLLEAIRAGVHHQVDERHARPVLRAIDAFEQAEAKRWAQVRAGTLPPIEVPLEVRLQDLIEEGYELLEADRHSDVCDRWLEAWELVKQLARPEMRTVEAFDDAYYPGWEFVSNWCDDLEMELGNAGLRDSAYHEHRLRYCREVLAQFPDEEPSFHVSFNRAQGEALWHLGRREEAEAVYAALVKRFPDDAWGYIGWADQYSWGSDTPKEYESAEAILKRALARPRLEDRRYVLDRLEDLYGEWGKPEAQAAVAAELRRLLGQPEEAPSPTSTAPPAKKLARNAPCWCGSGKKYKRCHLQSDEEARR